MTLLIIVVAVLLLCFWILSLLSWPFIILFCKLKIKKLRKQIESCSSDDNSSVKRKLGMRVKYINYDILLNALKPNHLCHYYVKPITLDSVKDEKFALFLRGFEKDVYNSDIRNLAKRNFESFSEYHFTKYLSNYLPVYAVGMTNEIRPAIGSKRVYLSEETWQSDILELMNKAAIIIILINNKKNCIWEIEQSLKFHSKTIYIVDDINKYREVASYINAQDYVSNGVPFYNIDWSFCYLRSESEVFINPLSHDINSYRAIVAYYTETIFKLNKKSFFSTNRKELIILLIVFGIMLIENFVIPNLPTL